MGPEHRLIRRPLKETTDRLPTGLFEASQFALGQPGPSEGTTRGAMTTTDATRMEDDDHATHAAPRSSKTGVRDRRLHDRSPRLLDSLRPLQLRRRLDEDPGAVDGDEERTMEDEDPDPAFETIERGPRATSTTTSSAGYPREPTLTPRTTTRPSTTTTRSTTRSTTRRISGRARRDGSRCPPPRRSPRSSPRGRARPAHPPPPPTFPSTPRQEEEAAQPRHDRRAQPRGEGVVRGPRHTSQPPAARGTPRARTRDKLDPDFESTARRDAACGARRGTEREQRC